MGNLFLQGGGSYPQTAGMDKLFFDKIDRSRPLLYLPMAMVGHLTFDQCYEYFATLARNFTNKEIIMWTEIKGEDLQQFGGIYIGGGNTFKLLQDIQNAEFSAGLESYLINGGTVCGGSAGAIVFGKEVNTSRDVNIVNLKDTKGLNMLNGYSLWCHYKEQDDEEILIYTQNYGVDVIALKDQCGLVIAEGMMTPIGDVYVFSKKGKEKFNPIPCQTEKS